MASSVEEQPTPANYSSFRCKLDRILQSTVRGTPFNRSNRRRFGPLGSTTKKSVLDSPRRSARVGGSRGRYSDETPLTHKARRSETVIERSEQEESNIRELRGKQWRAYRVTPLHNYQIKKSDFQYYSRCLSSHIAAEAQKGTFIDTTVPDDAVIGHFSGFDVSDNDPKALLIDVKGKARNGSTQVISQAVLFSTDLEMNPLKETLQDKFTYFSCMLIRGPVVHAETIQNWLEVQFDCRVIPLTFSSFELGFMTAMFTGLEDDSKSVELVYSIPKEVEGLSTITYSTRAEDCKRLWDSVRSKDHEGFTYEEASKFMSGLESHFFHCFSIKLSVLSLITIQTAIASVGRQGQIKFITKSVNDILKVLRHLTDLALDQLKTV